MLSIKKKVPLWLQLTIVMGAMSLFLIIGGKLAIQQVLQLSMQQDLEEQHIRFASIFSASSGEAIIAEDIEIIRANLEQVAKLENGLREVHVTNEDRKTLVRWKLNHEMPPDAIFKHSNNAEYYGETFGYIDSTWDISAERSAVTEKVDSITRVVMGLFAGLTTLIFCIGHFMLTRPLGKLHRSLEALRNGNHEKHSTLNNSLEIFHLSEALNDLADSLQVQAKNAQALDEARALAESASKAKSDFLATMSHEIRTPMNGIIGFTETLLSSNLDEDQSQHLQCIKKSGDNLLNIINDILDFSKIENKKIDFEVIDFNLMECIEEALEIQSQNASTKDVDLLYHIAPSVSIYQRGDVGRIRQVLINLVSNGLKFTQSGQVVVNVTQTSDEFYQIAVCDTGIGFDSSIAKHLFSPFQQADSSTTRKYGGTGLGLAICKQLVELMGGSISAKSEPGKGSTFTLSLPNVPGMAPLDATRPLKSFHRLKILVTDDHPLCLEFLQVRLERLGCEVTVALSAEAALKIVNRPDSGFDLLITDMLMPGMNGLDMAREVKRYHRDLCPLMVLASSSLHEDSKDQAHQAGYQKLIYKPVRDSQLYDILNSVSNDKQIEKKKASSGPKKYIHQKHNYVLIVEDNPINAKIAKLLLERFGLPSHVAQDGVHALERLLNAERTYRAILMDMQMPIMDGLEATRRIRLGEGGVNHTHCPIIAMTANAMEDDEAKCLEVGMDAYISKPINVTKLEKTLLEYGLIKLSK